VDHFDYTTVSDRHTCFIRPFLIKTVAFLEHTKETLHL